jgi:hypothetical protein
MVDRIRAAFPALPHDVKTILIDEGIVLSKLTAAEMADRASRPWSIELANLPVRRHAARKRNYTSEPYFAQLAEFAVIVERAGLSDEGVAPYGSARTSRKSSRVISRSRSAR